MQAKDTFFEKFGTNKKFFPVIRALTVQHAMNDMAVIKNVDGVFLKRHETSPKDLYQMYQYISERYLECFIGVCPDTNKTGRDIFDVSQQNYVDAFWATESGFNFPNRTFTPYNVWAMSRIWGGHYFAEVHLGRITDTINLVETVHEASQLSDVIVLRGGEGETLPKLETVMQVKNIIPHHPIAIVGLMTPKKITPYLPLVDIFIADHGIYKKGDRLSATRVSALNDTIQDCTVAT